MEKNLWLHGTQTKLSSLDETDVNEMSNKEVWLHGTETEMTIVRDETQFASDYCNAGLGLFLTQSIDVAKDYARNGYIATLEVDMSKCHTCSEDDFWCRNEEFNAEEDLDHMGNWAILPGTKTRQKFLEAGYTTLIYNDKEMGEVLVLLDKNAAKLINCVEVSNKPSKKFK